MKCPTPIIPDNSSLSNSSNDCRYHSLEIENLAEEPSSSLRVRKINSYNRPDSKYLKYSIIGASDDLDNSAIEQKNAGVFPRQLYKKEPFAYSPSYLIVPRDVNYHYTYSPEPNPQIPGDKPKERSSHTERSSRFGYDRYPNEWILGQFTRGYVEPPECHYCQPDIPKNMAPKRFYTDYHLLNNPTEFRKLDQSPPMRMIVNHK